MRGYAPENTLRSFQKALELNVDVVELDVHVCGSGELVVIHDDKIDRTTSGGGSIREKTWEELKDLNAGHKEKIPLLSEVLDFIDKKAQVNIELKGIETADSVHNLIEDYVINGSWEYSDFLVSSFDHYKIKDFKKLNSKIKTGALLSGIPIDLADFASKADADFIGLDKDFISQDFINDAHKKQLDAYVWTVNNPEDIKIMKDFGVDGIFSDFPDRI